jgi:hypothetical protein
MTAEPDAPEEILRQEGENFRSIMVSITPAGGLQLDAQDMGKLVEEVWGDSDYEFWVTIPPEGLAKLAKALVKKASQQRSQTVMERRYEQLPFLRVTAWTVLWRSKRGLRCWRPQLMKEEWMQEPPKEYC